MNAITSQLALQLALIPWEALIYLGLCLMYLRAWSRLDAAPDGGGEAALGWRHGAQAISVSAAGTMIALAFMAATLLGLAGGATIELLPKGMSVLQVIVLIGAFDAVVATGAATLSVAVSPRWLSLDDQARDRSVLMRLMTARSWLIFALLRLALAGALITLDPAAGMARHAATDAGQATGQRAGAQTPTDLGSKIAGMEARLDDIARVKLPALTVKFDAAAEEIKKEFDKAVAAGRQAAGWPDKKLAPAAMRLRAALDQLRAAFRTEIEATPVAGMTRASALGPSVVTVLERFAEVLEQDNRSPDSRKAETVRALLGLLQPLARRMGVATGPASSSGMAQAPLSPADLPAPVTFSFPSGGNAVPASTDDGRPLAAALDGISAFIAGHAGCLVVVEGHADAKGREDTNLLLSLERAEGIAIPLREKLSPDHVIAVPLGERQPLVKTKDGVENPENRRVRVATRCPAKIKSAKADKLATVH